MTNENVLGTLYDSETTSLNQYVALTEACPTYYLEISTLDSEVGEVSGILTVSLDYSETNE